MRVWRRLLRAETAIAAGAETVAGVDEAGRGPLAGPVVAAAVILDRTLRWDGLDDSKKLDEPLREQLYARVLHEARAFGWSVVGPRAIDALNIRRASLEAMRRAVLMLRVAPALVLVDGLDEIPGVTLPQRAVVDGDARMLSIAAASVVAKVVRDRIMTHLDRVWPDYGFAQHKGYGTPEHLEVLRRRGPCPIHRYSFAPVRIQELPLFDAPAEPESDAVPATPIEEAVAAAVAVAAEDPGP